LCVANGGCVDDDEEDVHKFDKIEVENGNGSIPLLDKTIDEEAMLLIPNDC
jgi:hypothetical protein